MEYYVRIIVVEFNPETETEVLIQSRTVDAESDVCDAINVANEIAGRVNIIIERM